MQEFLELINIVEKLRAPEGCPWDREQTHESLRPMLIEEAYEALEALSAHDLNHFEEELGDLLLHIVLHAQIASESKAFNIQSLIKRLNEKLIRRHPHVFGDLNLSTTSEVKENWDKIKLKERNLKTLSGEDLFKKIPPCTGALFKSKKMGEVAAKFHFDWQEPEDIKVKIQEEIMELETCLKDSDKQDQEGEMAIKEELGDLLFTICQWSRRFKIDAEDALQKSNDKFKRRFLKMLDIYRKNHSPGHGEFKDLSPSQKESLWREAKKSFSSTERLLS